MSATIERMPSGPKTIADPNHLRHVALKDPVFRDGYETWGRWAETTKDGADPPQNPHASGTVDAPRWELGREQAELEAGSPDSWQDGGGGRVGVLALGFTVVEG